MSFQIGMEVFYDRDRFVGLFRDAFEDAMGDLTFVTQDVLQCSNAGTEVCVLVFEARVVAGHEAGGFF